MQMNKETSKKAAKKASTKKASTKKKAATKKASTKKASTKTAPKKKASTKTAPKKKASAKKPSAKKPSTTASTKEQSAGKNLLFEVGLKKETGWFYFLDRDFNVARVPVRAPDTAQTIIRRLAFGDPSIFPEIQTVRVTPLKATDRNSGMLYSLNDRCDIYEEPLHRSGLG